MLTNSWMTALACLEVSAMAAVLLIMGRRPALIRRWPSLFAFVLAEFSADMVLMCWLNTKSHYRHYFYTFWISRAILAVLRLWVIADIVRNIPAIKILPSKAYLFVAVAGLTLAACCAGYSYGHPGRVTIQTRDMALLLNQSVNIGWVAFSISVLGAIKLFNLGWEAQGANIALGVFFRVVGSTVAGEMMISHSRLVRLYGNGFESIVTIAVFSFWSFALIKTYEYAREPSQNDGLEVTRSIRMMLELIRER